MTHSESEPERSITGVQDLIDALREEGVEEGRTQAQQIIEDAKAEKRRILDEAEREAQRRKDEAQREIDSMKRAANDALQQAARDSLLDLRKRMLDQFSEDVRQLVSQEIREHEILKQLILCVARRAGEALDTLDVAQITIELPRTAPGLDDLRREPGSLNQDELMRLVLGITGDRLRDGLVLRVAEDDRAGIRVIESENEIEFDLTEEAMAEVMLEHLQPRFRALLEGIVR